MCVLAVTLHRTVVFYWIEKITVVTILGTLVTWDQGGGGGGIRLVSGHWHGTVILPCILSAQHQQLLPGGEDGDVSVPHQTTFSSSEKSPPVIIPSLLRLWALRALHDGGGYQTHHNHGPCLSQGIDGDQHQQLHLGGLGEGCADRTS